jgi:hypothetical protein
MGVGDMVKRYLLFAGDNYYPSGGWHDSVKGYDDIDSARKAGRETAGEWWHVVDLELGAIVAGDYEDRAKP